MRSGSNAEIECDGDAQSVAPVRSDLMKEPRGKQEQEARSRPDGLRRADRLAVFSHEFQTRRVHSGSGPAGIEHFELAAQTRIRSAAAVSDIVGPGPERAGMIVADIPVARPVDVRPRHDAPFGLDRFAVSIGGQAIGHLFGQIENEGDLRAAPDGDLAIRVPASRIGSLNRWTSSRASSG